MGCLILLLASCNSSPASRLYLPTRADSLKIALLQQRWQWQLGEVKQQVHSGDLVTRTGNDFTSECLRKLNQRDQTYSHCGIASLENDSLFVYHALGGDFNPDQKIRRDPFEMFADASGNKGIAVYRMKLPDSMLREIVRTARSFFDQEIMFDMNFDLASNDRMYCAEYIYKTMRRGSKGTLSFRHSHIKGFEFIGVDDLFLHPLSVKQVSLTVN